jgi:hypothetical protein
MSSKIKAKRNSSITKIFKMHNSGIMTNSGKFGNYGGANVK